MTLTMRLVQSIVVIILVLKCSCDDDIDGEEKDNSTLSALSSKALSLASSGELSNFTQNWTGRGGVVCKCGYHHDRDFDNPKNYKCTGSPKPCKSVPEPVEFQVFNGAFCDRQFYNELETFNDPDPYVELWYRTQPYKGKTKNEKDCDYKHFATTKETEGSCYPDFNENKRFKAEYCKDPGRYESLDLYVYDEDPGMDDYIGTGQILVSELYDRLEQEVEFYIYNPGAGIVMDVKLRMYSQVKFTCDNSGFVKNAMSSESFDCVSVKDGTKTGLCMVSKRQVCCSGQCDPKGKTSSKCTCAKGKPGSRCKSSLDCADTCSPRKDATGKQIAQRTSCQRTMGKDKPTFCVCVDK